MNIIKENLLFILFPILIFIYYVIPIDFIYFILLSPVIGFVEAVFLFIYEKKKRYSIGILIIDFFFIFIFYLLNVNLYFYYHKIWNILFFILNLTIISTLFFPLFSKYSKRKKITGFFIIVLLVFFKSFIFDTKYYFATTSSTLIQDIRYFKKEGYCKVIGNHKLLRKNPDCLTKDDADRIVYLLNKTDWLEENYPDLFMKSEILPDDEYIKNNIRYVCSTIGLYNIIEADIYCLKIAPNKSDFIKLYIPKGRFTLYDESDMEKYYDKQLNLIKNCYFEGVLLPPLTEDCFLELTR